MGLIHEPGVIKQLVANRCKHKQHHDFLLHNLRIVRKYLIHNLVLVEKHVQETNWKQKFQKL